MPRTVEQVHQVLHIALSYGVRMQLLAHNVAEFIDHTLRSARWWPLNPNLDKLLEAAHKTPLFALITVAGYTGMRRGELLGLGWENVDLENATVRVEGLLQRVNRETIVKGPKTADCSPHDPSYVTHRFSEIARKAGFKMRLHDLRHTYATLALASKVDLQVVQELMSHEDMSTTANIYTYVLKGLERDAANAIGRTINGGIRHHPGTESESDRDPQEKH